MANIFRHSFNNLNYTSSTITNRRDFLPLSEVCLMATRNVAILMFDDVEVLDFAGPFEVFSVTSELSKGDRPFAVSTVAEQPGAVSARNGLSVNPDCTISDCPPPDILIVPGGQGTRKLIDNSAVINWIKDSARTAELVLSVCTGSLLLAKARVSAR